MFFFVLRLGQNLYLLEKLVYFVVSVYLVVKKFLIKFLIVVLLKMSVRMANSYQTIFGLVHLLFHLDIVCPFIMNLLFDFALDVLFNLSLEQLGSICYVLVPLVVRLKLLFWCNGVNGSGRGVCCSSRN